MDASEIHAKKLNAKDVTANERWKHHIPNRRWNSKTLWRRLGPENIHPNPGSPRPRRRTRKSCRRIGRVFFNPISRLIVVWWWSQKWFLVYFIWRHHVEPRVKLYVPREASFPIPRKYIDVTRTTNTTSDMMSEKQIEDYWNVDGDRELSDAWTGFTRFTFLNEKNTGWIYMLRFETDKKQTTSRPDTVWPEMWKHMSDTSKRKEKQKWAIEKPKLDKCQKIAWYLLHCPDDAEFKRSMKNCS